MPEGAVPCSSRHFCLPVLASSCASSSSLCSWWMTCSVSPGSRLALCSSSIHQRERHVSRVETLRASYVWKGGGDIINPGETWLAERLWKWSYSTLQRYLKAHTDRTAFKESVFSSFFFFFSWKQLIRPENSYRVFCLNFLLANDFHMFPPPPQCR